MPEFKEVEPKIKLTGQHQLPPGWVDPEAAVPAHAPPNPMNLEIHLQETRERTAGMTPRERAWRKKWIHDQHLEPDEPLDINVRPLNPIRKLYRFPLDWLESRVLRKTFGWWYARKIRYFTGRTLTWYSILLVVFYYVKYNRKTWEHMRGIGFSTTFNSDISNYEQRLDKEFPGLAEKAKTPVELFGDDGFQRRKVLLDLEPPERYW